MASPQASRPPDLLKGRICELLESWRPWQRRLWDLGTVLALREAVEAADWVGRRVLSSAATSWYARESLLPRLGSDAALGDGQVRRSLREVCQQSIKPGSRGQRSLALLADRVEDGYLSRWRDLLVVDPVHVERAARCIAAHMLDMGFHQDYLRHQIKSRLDATSTAADLVNLFIELEMQGEHEFSGLIVLQGKVPAAESAEKSPLWLSQEAISTRLSVDFPGHRAPSGSGGLHLRVHARDPYSAAHEITETFDRLQNRVRYLRGPNTLTAYPYIFMTGIPEPQEFRRGDPAVTILSLARTGALYNTDVGDEASHVDDALELAAPLTGSSPSSAVAGAWAALESLLFCDTDEADREEGRAVAADRAAAVVSAGWPRAELTTLSYDKDLLATDRRLQHQLSTAGKQNQERVRILVDWLASRPTALPTDPSTAAALERMRELVDRPRPTLGRVNNYLRGALRRLYRQRNIVLHGGSIRSVALRASLRTAGPLVGAALDRVAHGYTSCDVVPLDLASRAELAIKLVSDRDGWGLHELLGT